ncbi:hypothetical protein DFH09DRAFT_1305206 [Mycena vulgaris]|nr:hypothetical protein DFH09DRAFT_1305206 [Mycena vulgaris]
MHARLSIPFPPPLPSARAPRPPRALLPVPAFLPFSLLPPPLPPLHSFHPCPISLPFPSARCPRPSSSLRCPRIPSSLPLAPFLASCLPLRSPVLVLRAAHPSPSLRLRSAPFSDIPFAFISSVPPVSTRYPFLVAAVLHPCSFRSCFGWRSSRLHHILLVVLSYHRALRSYTHHLLPSSLYSPLPLLSPPPPSFVVLRCRLLLFVVVLASSRRSAPSPLCFVLACLTPSPFFPFHITLLLPSPFCVSPTFSPAAPSGGLSALIGRRGPISPSFFYHPPSCLPHLLLSPFRFPRDPRAHLALSPQEVNEWRLRARTEDFDLAGEELDLEGGRPQDEDDDDEPSPTSAPASAERAGDQQQAPEKRLARYERRVSTHQPCEGGWGGVFTFEAPSLGSENASGSEGPGTPSASAGMHAYEMMQGMGAGTGAGYEGMKGMWMGMGMSRGLAMGVGMGMGMAYDAPAAASASASASAAALMGMEMSAAMPMQLAMMHGSMPMQQSMHSSMGAKYELHPAAYDLHAHALNLPLGLNLGMGGGMDMGFPCEGLLLSGGMGWAHASPQHPALRQQRQYQARMMYEAQQQGMYARAATARRGSAGPVLAPAGAIRIPAPRLLYISAPFLPPVPFALDPRAHLPVSVSILDLSPRVVFLPHRRPFTSTAFLLPFSFSRTAPRFSTAPSPAPWLPRCLLPLPVSPHRTHHPPSSRSSPSPPLPPSLGPPRPYPPTHRPRTAPY